MPFHQRVVGIRSKQLFEGVAGFRQVDVDHRKRRFIRPNEFFFCVIVHGVNRDGLGFALQHDVADGLKQWQLVRDR